MQKTINRREFLRGAGAASAMLLTPPFALLPSATRTAHAGAHSGPAPDVEILLTATKGEAPILSGRSTAVWTYRGKVLKGEAGSVQPISGSYLGPIIRVRKGQRVRIHFENALAEASNIHWHGLHVPDDMDGHPRHTAAPGKRYVYEFEIKDRAGTYWFHPHPHGRTGHQVYFGLAGLFIVSDEEEQAAQLPAGEYDLPLILQDRSFDKENRLVFLSDGQAGRGMRGGGMMGGGMMGGGMMGMMGNQKLPNGAAFPVFKVRVERREKAPGALPKRLSTIVRHRAEDAVNFRRPRVFNITMGMMQWGVNGRSFEMEGVADDEIVRLNTLEIWEFTNDASTGMMGMMAHPMHIHGLQFQILERGVKPALAEAVNSVSAGYVNEGWKDEVFLMPGERAKVLLAFKDFGGLFPYHCHMLEHGDTGLMRNYLVRA